MYQSKFVAFLDPLLLVVAIIVFNAFPNAKAVPAILFGLFLLSAVVHLLARIDVNLAGVFDYGYKFSPSTRAVDPWLYHRRLMEISDQPVQATPRLTNDSVLYAALVMEETAEFYEALIHAIGYGNDSAVLSAIVQGFHRTASDSRRCSRHVRQLLGSVVLDKSLTAEHAEALLHESTDVIVVSCGFQLSTGLPGAAAYAAVASANLSKANPDTGLIDKDVSGKWIKGKDFVAADLTQVLAEHV